MAERMSWRLLAGRMRHAWLEYPAMRRRIAAVPPGPPIFLTGTHRSGTTWLARMLAASGVWYMHEPYAKRKGRWPRSFEYRRSCEPDPQADAILEDVLAGRFREALGLANSDHSWMPLRLFRTRFSRVLVKDPLACLLTEYLTRRFQLRTLILFRHPAGFVSSIQRLKWPRAAFLRQFLQDVPLMQDHLDPFRPLLERASLEENLEATAVFCGALNRVLWNFHESGVGQPISFEYLCHDPLPRLQKLFAELGLPYDSRVRQVHEQACMGAAKPSEEYHPHAVVRNSKAMAMSWRSQLSPTEISRVRDIWSRFQIPLYLDDTDWI